MLVDSSVWIDFLRGANNTETSHLIYALDRGDSVWTAPPILQEVLQGADTPQRFAKWDRLLGELPMIVEADMRALTRQSARLYATCRWKGLTPRSANDCLIATYAIRNELPLLHSDRDFVAIAKIDRRLKFFA